MNMTKIISWMVMALGIITFLEGLFELKESLWGFRSHNFELGLTWLMLGYIMIKEP